MLALLAGGVLRAADPEVEDLKRRLESVEKQLAETKAAAPSETNYSKNIFPTVRTAADGIWVQTSDGESRIRLGGRVQIDSAWYNTLPAYQQTLNSPLQDGVALRRATYEVDGTLWSCLDFAFQADVAQSTDLQSSPTDPQPNIYIQNAWVGMTDVLFPGTIKVGHQKEAMLFVTATSGRFLPFMERPGVFDGLNNDYIFETGVSYQRSWYDDRLTGFVSLFKPGSRTGGFSVADGKYAFMTRWFGYPIYDEAEKRWLYVGASAAYRNLISNNIQYRVRPLVRSGSSSQNPNLLNTGSLYAPDGNEVAGFGAYAAFGPVTFGGEYLASFLDGASKAVSTGVPGAPLGNLMLHGFYVEALCFLTPGDHHTADRGNGGLGRVSPVCPVRRGGGFGAWEVGVRYDHFDADTAGLRAGKLDSLTVGLNWYLNPNVHWTLNYVYTRYDGQINAPVNALGARFAVDF